MKLKKLMKRVNIMNKFKLKNLPLTTNQIFDAKMKHLKRLEKELDKKVKK